MPNLPQMYALANSKTSYSRETEILPALDEAGQYVYNEVVNTFRGFFLKFDTTSVSFVPGTQEYTLPLDVEQLVHVAERASTANPFLPMAPEDIGDALESAQDQVGWSDYYVDLYGSDSSFSYAGPYLDAASTQGTQVQKIMVSPLIDVPRFVQLAYTAKWLPITTQQSPMMLPMDGTNAMLNLAIAELHRGNDDSLMNQYQVKGMDYLSNFLKVMRARQIQRNPQVRAYLSDTF